MNVLKGQDILALSFMTFALFVGAGNIIFPPMIGLQAGPAVWAAAAGFLVTAVGLPVLTVVALARVGGAMETLSAPIGRRASAWLAGACYLLVGPLFATPRTATASFEVGIAPLLGHGHWALFCYSVLYFLLVWQISRYPGKLLDTVGRVLAPLKILALFVLGLAAFLWPLGTPGPAAAAYQTEPFAQGAIGGYLTMDTLAALVFGIVIINAIRSRGVQAPRLLARYASIAGLVAGLGLTLVYLSLFQLGASSYAASPDATNGAVVLHDYVQHVFGATGSVFLAALMFLACLVTAVGLTCACAEHFSRVLRQPYHRLVWGLSVFSVVVSNLGLSQLILWSEPVMVAIYPPCIVMVLLSFFQRCWRAPTRVVAPTMAVALLGGTVQALVSAWPQSGLAAAWQSLPLASVALAWLVPVVVVLVVAIAWDRVGGVPKTVRAAAAKHEG